MTQKNVGTIVQAIGPVLDIRFPNDAMPQLLNAIEIEHDGKKLVAEVAQHIGDDVVRCIAMSSTDGLQRGIPATDTGSPITVPVGEACLGRIFNLLGEPVDNGPAPEAEERWPIHRPAPSYEEQESTTEILETGIKVVDLICPYAKGGKIGLFGGAGVGKTVHHGTDQQRGQGARRHLRVHRRGRAYPRGQRPVQRDDRKRRSEQDRTGLRPDERTARSPYARGAQRTDHGRVLPRPEAPGRAAVH